MDALQHLTICRIALATSYATIAYSDDERLAIPGNGPNDVAVHIKELVTIARLNMFSGWSLQIASHALHRFGVELEHPADRWEIMEFLEMANSSSLPTIVTQERLKKHWGWQL